VAREESLPMQDLAPDQQQSRRADRHEQDRIEEQFPLDLQTQGDEADGD
jgi:hypothetical protein